jgi:hypothetical protein
MATYLTSYGINSIPIGGRYLAHNHLGRTKRAFLGADLVTGTAHLVAPTQVQAAILAGVNRTYVQWALKQAANRAEIENGQLPLVPPHSKGMTDDAALFEIIREVGVERILTVAAAVDAQPILY